MTADSPLAAALRLLTLRDRSEQDLAGRLRRKGHDEAAIAATLQRCREFGYLDDSRFARQRAKGLLASGRAVGSRLLTELKQQGIDEQTAREAAAEASAEIDPDQLLTELLQKRFADFRYAEADERQRRRVIQYFMRRGFSLSRVLAILKEER
ncbi:regulatory protein RecX [Trichloromonas sp.]|uniref:regulatory protein RecX n=1 Tax=Trichloromonas sp. TaxID=3069249 RepID=UPI003D81A35D